MCGIAGFVGRGNRVDLEQMHARIQHRGPDNAGVYYEEGIGLAHARLSIIDLSPQGHQPMWNSDGTVSVVFNGEIYNFRELREELSRQEGYVFSSGTDTEVVLALYKKYGERCFEKLDGMFAIALYDKISGELFLARDRFGKKPLFWGVYGETLLFGSELKALLAHPSFKKEISLKALNKYLSYEYVPTPDTIFENTYKLEPATYVVFHKEQIRKECYWKADLKTEEFSFLEAKKAVKETLESAVVKRLVSDVPLGVFLSGGIDSSLVAYFAQKHSTTPIKTFSIGFKEESFDESVYAERVSAFLKTDHSSRVVSSRDLLAVIPKLGEVIDEPFADPSIIPTLLLSQFAKEQVTVVLGGDGGDELFAGYPTFQADNFFKIFSVLPLVFQKKAIEILAYLIPVSDKNFSFRFKLKRFAAGIGLGRYRHQAWLGSFSKEQKKQLLLPHVHKIVNSQNEYEDAERYYGEVRGNPQDKELYVYMRTYLMDDVLVKVDRASMRYGLEVRAPFLDTKLVELSNKIPYTFKVKGLTTKYVLKKVAEPFLPKSIIYRKKKGFGIPLTSWLKTDLKSLCDELLSEETILKQNLFKYAYIKKLKEEHFSGKEDNRKELWTLMMFQLWYKKWM